MPSLDKLEWEEVVEDIRMLKLAAKLIPAPIPFVYDIENDTIHVGHPGERHSDIPAKLTLNVVEGLYTPDGKIQFKSDSTMPYTVRHLIRLWYTLYPELEVKQILKMVGDKSFKLAKAQDVGQQVRSIAFTDQSVKEVYDALAYYCNLYAVGGAVRDIVLGSLPKDIDLLAQGLSAEEIETLLNTLPGRTDFTGKTFGVFRYRAEDGSETEIALPRTEMSTGEGHKDFQVQTNPYLPVEEDLARRDFTSNAMAVSLQTGELVDPFHGQHDLSQGTLKLVNPQAFEDDPLRIMRAFAAISRQGLRPDEDTKKEIEKQAYRLRALPAERIQMELDKIFGGRDPESAIRAMRDTGVLHFVLPEIAATIDFDQKNKHHRRVLDEHLLHVLRQVAEKSGDPDLRLAALLHDIGKPSSQWIDEDGNGHYYKKIHLDPVTHKPTGEEQGANHEEVGTQMTHDLMDRLKYPNSRRDRVKHLVKHHMFNQFENPRGARKFLNQVGTEHAHDLLTLREADSSEKGTDEWENQTPVSLQRQLVDRISQEDQATKISDLAVNGNDLIAAGISAGPEMGRILNKLLEAVLDHPEYNTPEQLIEMALNLHKMKDAATHESNILDPVKEALDDAVFNHEDGEMPVLKPKIRHWVKKTVYRVLRDNGYADPENWLALILTGSLTTYQWSASSDFDVSLWVDAKNLPDWRRADMVSLMVHHLDGVTVPGTTHALQAYVVPEGIGKDDLYRPGHRSAYDIDKAKWLVLPERQRVIDVHKEMRAALLYAKEMAYKMKLLLRYDPSGAKEFYRQIHQRRKRDMAAGKSDYSDSNITFKYLERHGLTPENHLTAALGSAILRVSGDGSANGRPEVERRQDFRTIALHLHHKNGASNDHRLENMCFLCPNCHSQTPTFAGKNKNQSMWGSVTGSTPDSGSGNPSSNLGPTAMNLWLDDIRPAPRGWMQVHSVNDAIQIMKSRPIENMSLDHDLGDYAKYGGDAVKLVLWMAENNIWPTNQPEIHSANPVGRENMQAYIDRYGPWNKREGNTMEKSVFYKKETAENPDLFTDTPTTQWYKWGWHPNHNLLVWPVSGNDGLPMHAEKFMQEWPAFNPDDAWGSNVKAGRFPGGAGYDPRYLAENKDFQKLPEDVQQELWQRMEATQYSPS